MENRQSLIGERIRRRRMALGMMQNDLADAVKMPQGHISRMERGRFVTMHPDHLVDIAQALKTTTDFLLGLTSDPTVTRGRTPSRRRTKDALDSNTLGEEDAA